MHELHEGDILAVDGLSVFVCMYDVRCREVPRVDWVIQLLDMLVGDLLSRVCLNMLKL